MASQIYFSKLRPDIPPGATLIMMLKYFEGIVLEKHNSLAWWYGYLHLQLLFFHY